MGSRTGSILAAATLFAAGAAAQDGYAPLARSIATPLFTTSELATRSRSDNAVMRRTELAYQVFGAISSSDEDVTKVQEEIYSHLESAHYSMEELRRLDNTTPDYSSAAASIIRASPALVRKDESGHLLPQDVDALEDAGVELVGVGLQYVVNWYNAMQERGRYAGHYIDSRRTGLKLMSVAAAHCTGDTVAGYTVPFLCEAAADGGLEVVRVLNDMPAGGPRVGDRVISVSGVTRESASTQSMNYALFGDRGEATQIRFVRGNDVRSIELAKSVEIPLPQLVGVQVDGSWAGYYSSDELFFTNESRRELTNVTLLVTLEGRARADGSRMVDQHLHFLDRWPAGSTRVASYLSSSASGIASNESADQIDFVSYWLLCDQFQQSFKVPYTGSAYDEDVRMYWGQSGDELAMSWRTFDNHTFFENGALIARRDGQGFPCTHVTVEAVDGGNVQRIRWSLESGKYPSGALPETPVLNGPRYFEDTRFNSMSPDRVSVTVEFPFTDFTATETWTFE